MEEYLLILGSNLSKALIILGVFRVVLGQKKPNSLRWVHFIVIQYQHVLGKRCISYEYDP